MIHYNRGSQIAAQLANNAVTPAVQGVNLADAIAAYKGGADWMQQYQDNQRAYNQKLALQGLTEDYGEAVKSGNTGLQNAILAQLDPAGYQRNQLLDRQMRQEQENWQRNFDANNVYKNAMLKLSQMKQQNPPLSEDDKKILAGSIKLPETIANLEAAVDYSDKGYNSSGLTGLLAQSAGYLFGTDSRENMNKAENLVKTVILPELKTMFGSNPTEGERAAALALAGIDPTLSPETRRDNLRNLQKMLINQNNANIQARRLQAFAQPYEMPTDGTEAILQGNIQQGGAVLPNLAEATKKLKTGGKVQRVGNFNVEIL